MRNLSGATVIADDAQPATRSAPPDRVNRCRSRRGPAPVHEALLRLAAA
jgi:hypothetical protein